MKDKISITSESSSIKNSDNKTKVTKTTYEKDLTRYVTHKLITKESYKFYPERYKKWQDLVKKYGKQS